LSLEIEANDGSLWPYLWDPEKEIWIAETSLRDIPKEPENSLKRHLKNNEWFVVKGK
jgi:hypothetical protein